jgi:hypothetical protein
VTSTADRKFTCNLHSVTLIIDGAPTTVVPPQLQPVAVSSNNGAPHNIQSQCPATIVPPQQQPVAVSSNNGAPTTPSRSVQQQWCPHNSQSQCPATMAPHNNSQSQCPTDQRAAGVTSAKAADCNNKCR